MSFSEFFSLIATLLETYIKNQEGKSVEIFRLVDRGGTIEVGCKLR